MTNSKAPPKGGEILLYQTPSGEVRVECLFQDETIWLTQKAKLKAEQEYEVFRQRQDHDYISDFDREIKRLEGGKS